MGNVSLYFNVTLNMRPNSNNRSQEDENWKPDRWQQREKHQKAE